MNLIIELPDELETALQTRNVAQGVSAAGFVQRLLDSSTTRFYAVHV
jgi:hypothetical protein